MNSGGESFFLLEREWSVLLIWLIHTRIVLTLT